jgi:hypothetical protein
MTTSRFRPRRPSARGPSTRAPSRVHRPARGRRPRLPTQGRRRRSDAPRPRDTSRQESSPPFVSRNSVSVRSSNKRRAVHLVTGAAQRRAREQPARSHLVRRVRERLRARRERLVHIDHERAVLLAPIADRAVTAHAGDALLARVTRCEWQARQRAFADAPHACSTSRQQRLEDGRQPCCARGPTSSSPRVDQRDSFRRTPSPRRGEREAPHPASTTRASALTRRRDER